MPLDASSFYQLRASNGVSVLCRRGEGPPTIVGGGARYTIIERPRRVSIVQWAGDDPYKMDVPILLDGWSSNTNIENDIARINQMRRSPGDLVPPVTLLIDGALPVHGARWVVEDLTWGGLVIWKTDKQGNGFRVRQDCLVHLLQYSTENTLSVKKPSTGMTLYTVKTGDTMASIAAHKGVTVAAIKSANGIRDQKTLFPGQQILIPPSLEHNQISRVQ